MKKFLSVLAVVTSCLVFFNSCANFDNSGTSLTLTFNGRDFIPADERNVTVSSDDAGFYFVVSLSGDYKETKFISFDYNKENYSITFNRVPVGANVTVHANVYRPRDKERMHYYSGTSDRIEISSGENFVNIDLNNLFISQTYEEGYNPTTSYYNYCSIWPPFDPSLFLYSNGKYIIKNTSNDNIYSEGTWYRLEDKVYFTEYSYKVISMNEDHMNEEIIYYADENSVSSSDTIIVTEPVEKTIDSDSPISFSKGYAGFQSGNGVFFCFYRWEG